MAINDKEKGKKRLGKLCEVGEVYRKLHRKATFV